jgi:glycosyltransferase involved in cell wall biosynthesis
MYEKLVKEEFSGFKEIDIIVGIPTRNEGDNISFVTKQVDSGIAKNFPGKKALLIDCDGNSEDNTKDVFLNTDTYAAKKFISTPPNVYGKGNSFRQVFEIVSYLKPEAVMVVDADLTSISPQWVRMMLMPIMHGYDYVTPYYTRNRFDASITNHICYPLLYGLLGYSIRQPIAGDFSFNAKLARYWLKQQWQETTGFYGIDIFMTTHAIFGNYNICQVSLGEKAHKPSAPKLDRMFSQVVGTLFSNVTENKDKWIKKDYMTDVKTMGVQTLDEPKMDIDKTKIFNNSLMNYKKEELREFLEKETFEKINDMFYKREIKIDSELWAHAVYDSLYAYYKSQKKSEMSEIVEALKSLYFGRLYSFINEEQHNGYASVEKNLLEQAKDFRKQKPYFVQKLNGLHPK